MTTAVYPSDTDTSERAPHWLWRRWPFGLARAHYLLLAILILAAYLNFSNLSAIGNANTYYTAAVKSMLQSWHNFFFVAAEPGGSVSVDKPPVGLWLEAVSAYFLGVNGFAVVLPNLIARLLNIVVLYNVVKKYFGAGAGLLAALVLAVTPVMIVVQRDNTPDSMLILALLLATWAFIQATESGKVRYLWLGAIIVGIGFNIKMLQAYLPLPAFYALFFFCAKTGWWRKIGNLTLATLILLVVSFSWAVAVDLTPANQRPYVGSSETNSVVDLALGYNGVSRLLGHWPGGFGRGVGGAANFGVRTSGGRALTESEIPNRLNGEGPNGPGANNGNNAFEAVPSGISTNGPLGFGNSGQGNGRAAGFVTGFGGDIGQPGILRLFSRSLANQASWLLPFALLGMVVIAFEQRAKFPLSLRQKGLLLWGSWLIITVLFFSLAGFFHSYYMAMMGPPVAALVAGGASSLWEMGKKHPALASFLLVVMGALTLAVQWLFIGYYQVDASWLPFAALLLIAGIALPLFFWNRVNAKANLKLASMGAIVLSILITPLVWTNLTMREANFNATLPSAYQGNGFSFGRGLANSAAPGNLPRGFPTNFPGGSPPINPGGFGVVINGNTVAYLQEKTQDIKYLLAVPSASEGSRLVLETGRPVLFMGGFTGTDPVVNAVDIAKLVADHQLRFIMDPGNRKEEISTWLAASCKVVDLATVNGSSSNITPANTTSPRSSAASKSSSSGQSSTGSATVVGNHGRAGGFGGGNQLYDCQG